MIDTRRLRHRLSYGEWRWWAVLIVLGLLLVPLLITRDFAPGDELKVLCLADEALSSHTRFAFSYHGEPCAGWITPLYMWFVMGCKWLFGQHFMPVLGLFSLVPAMLMVRQIDLWVTQDMHREREEWSDMHRFVAIMMLATTTYFLVGACMVRMGVLMCLFVTLALRQIWALMQGDATPRHQWLVGLYTLLAFLTKGFISILVPLLSPLVLALWTRRATCLTRTWTWRAWTPLVVGIVLWLVAVRLEGGSDYFAEMLSRWTMIPRPAHGMVALFYLRSLPLVLLPWTLVVLMTLLLAAARRIDHTPLQRYFLAVVLVVLIVLACQSARFEVFLLPLLPFLIYYSAMSLPIVGWNYLKSLSVGLPALILTTTPILLLIAGGAFAPADEIVFRGSWLLRPFFFLATFVVTVASVVSLVRNYRDHDLAAAIRPLTVGIILTFFVASFGINQDANAHFGYRELCQRIERLRKTSPKTKPEICTWRLKNAENLHVYLNCPTREVTTREVIAGRHRGDVVVVSLSRLREDTVMLDYFRNQHATFSGAYAMIVAK